MQIDLARVLALQGEVARAHALYQESLVLLRELNTRDLQQAIEYLVPCLEGLASIGASLGEPAWAARLWGAAEALREAIGAPMAPVYRSNYEGAVSAALAQSNLSSEPVARGRARATASTIATVRSACPAALPGETCAIAAFVLHKTTRASEAQQAVT